MAMILDCLHTLGILFSVKPVKHVFSIKCNHLCALGPRCLSCSTSMSSMPAALLFLSVAIPFLYSSSVNGKTSDCSLCSTVVRIGRFGLVAMFPLPLTSSWCATWLELTKHGGIGIIGSLEMLVIAFHTSHMLCVRSIEVISPLNSYVYIH